MAAGIPTNNLVMTLQAVLDSGIPAYRHCPEFLIGNFSQAGSFN